MNRILEDLFFGEIQPNANHDKNPHLKKGMQVINENEETLLKILDGKERKLFLDLINAQSEVSSGSSVDNFINGFKLGARIIFESLVKVQ